MNLPDPTPVTDLIYAFRCSKTMFTAVSLGIFDLLAYGPADLATLAARIGAQPAALERLLDACAGLGLLRKQDGQYANQPLADVYLTRSSPNTLSGYILYSDQVLYRLWEHLDDAVREGTHRWRQTFGSDAPLFDHFFRTEELMRTFMRAMHGFGMLSSPKAVAAFDLSRFRRLVDLGGGTGHFAIAACERYPELRATVLDLPRIIDIARQEVGRSQAAGRIDFVTADFFTDELPPADLYSACRILHDWTEEKIMALARKIYAALPAGGAFLVVEKLLDADKTLPVAATMQSLSMLVCTEGRERNLAEYKALLGQAGFNRVDGAMTGSPADAVIGWKL